MVRFLAGTGSAHVERVNPRHLLGSVTLLVVLTVMLSTVACGDDDDGCCPVSADFNCSSLEVGGAKKGGSCPPGIPDAVGSELRVDAKGCSYWAPIPGAGQCGQAGPRPDAGGDAADASDAGDASEAGDASDANDGSDDDAG